MFRWMSVCMVLALLISAVMACNSTPKIVRVAVTMPLGLEIGQDMLNGAKLALEQAGGQAGKVAVELLIADSSDPQGSPVSPDLEKEAALKATQDPTVVAYLGAATSDQAKASMAILNQAGILQLSPSATWPGLTKPGFSPGEPGVYYPTGRRHFFRVVPSDEVQGVAAARWAKMLGVQSVFIVDDGTTYGRGVSGVFEISAQDLGIRVLAYQNFTPNPAPQVISSLADRVNAAQPDLLFVGTSLGNGGSELIKAVRTLNRRLMIMLPDGMVQDQVIAEVGAELMEGIYGTNIVIPPDQLDTAADFYAAYRSAFGKEPPAYALTTYEAMRVILKAIEIAPEPTRKAVLDAVAQLGEFSGVLGNWEFDQRGDVSTAAISRLQVQGGVWAFVGVIK